MITQKWADQVESLLENETVIIRAEVLAEVVYVLDKVYKLPRLEIHTVITQFLDLNNVEIEDKVVIVLTLETYSQTRACSHYASAQICELIFR